MTRIASGFGGGDFANGYVSVTVFPGGRSESSGGGYGRNMPIFVQMASTLGTSTAWEDWEMLHPTGQRRPRTSLSIFPNDGQRRYFRANHRMPGSNDGTYSRTVSAIPQGQPADFTQSAAMANPSPLTLDTPQLAEGFVKGDDTIAIAGNVDVGSPAQSVGDEVVTKTLSFGAINLRPASAVSSTAFNYNVGGQIVTGASDTVTMDMVHSFVLPAGVTVTGFQSAQRRTVTGGDTGVTAVAQLGISTGSTAGVTALDTLGTSSGDADYQIFDSTTLAHTVTADDIFFVLGRVNYNTSTDISSLGVYRVTYTMPQYDDAY